MQSIFSASGSLYWSRSSLMAPERRRDHRVLDTCRQGAARKPLKIREASIGSLARTPSARNDAKGSLHYLLVGGDGAGEYAAERNDLDCIRYARGLSPLGAWLCGLPLACLPTFQNTQRRAQPPHVDLFRAYRRAVRRHLPDCYLVDFNRCRRCAWLVCRTLFTASQTAGCGVLGRREHVGKIAPGTQRWIQIKIH